MFVSPEFASWTARPLIPIAEGMVSTTMTTESFVGGGRLRQIPPLLHAGEMMKETPRSRWRELWGTCSVNPVPRFRPVW